MKQAALFLSVFLFQDSALATVDVKWDLTRASSNVFVKTFYDVAADDAVCTVSVTRPVDLEEPVETENQKITCSWKKGKQTRETSFAGSKIDSWGQRRDPRSFRVIGPAAQTMFDAFQKQTRGLKSPEPDDSMWTRLYLCDSNGAICTQPVILNAEPNKDSAGQIDCGRESTLNQQSAVTIDPDQYDDDHYPDYLDDMIDAQIKAGERTIDRVACTFIAP